MSSEDDKVLRECLMPDGKTIDLQKLREHPEAECVPIYGGPVVYRPKPWNVCIPADLKNLDEQVLRNIAVVIPCKHCGEFPSDTWGNGDRMEEQCVEGCPHDGAELFPIEWIEQNRTDESP